LITTRELLIFAKRFKLTYIKLIYYHQHNSHEEQDEEEEEETISQHSSENETVQLDRRASKTVDVQPYTTVAGKEIGLVVHNVEEGSYVDRVGELQTADRITEINGRDITSLSNTKAMEIYNEALHDEVIKLKRARSHSFLKDTIRRQNSADDIVGTDVPDQVRFLMIYVYTNSKQCFFLIDKNFYKSCCYLQF